MAAEAVAAIGTHADRVTETLAGRLEVFETTFLQEGGTLSAQLGDHANQFAVDLSNQVVRLESAFSEGGEALNAKVSDHTDRSSPFWLRVAKAWWNACPRRPRPRRPCSKTA